MTLLLDLPQAQESWVHRLDPRWKLAAIVGAAGAIAFLRTPLPALIALSAAMLLLLLSRLPPRWIAARVGAALLLPAFFVVWLPFSDDAGSVGHGFSLIGLLRAVTVIAKAGSVVSLMLVLIATAPLHETFKAAQSLGTPRWLVQLVLMSYRYIFLLTDEFVRLRTALRVRGYRNRANMHCYRTIGQVAGTLLVRGHERSERVAHAMQCRGFDGQFRSLHGFRTRAIDVLFCVLAMLIAGSVLAWDVWDR